MYVAGARRLFSSPTRFADALRRDRSSAVAVSVEAPWIAELRGVLRGAGWRRVSGTRFRRYELWFPPSRAGAGGARQGRPSAPTSTAR